MPKNDLPPDGFEDHPPDGYVSNSSGPPDGFEPKMTLGEAAKGAASTLLSPTKTFEGIKTVLETPEPHIEQLKKYLTEQGVSAVEKSIPQEQLSMGKLIEKGIGLTAAHFLPGMIPASAMDVLMMLGTGEALKGGGISEPAIPRETTASEVSSTELSTEIKKPELINVRPTPPGSTDPGLNFTVKGNVPMQQFKDFIKMSFPDKKVTFEKPSSGLDVDNYKVRFHGPEGQVEGVPEGWEKIFGKRPSVDPRKMVQEGAKEIVEGVLPESSKSAEHLAIDAETAGSQAPRQLGVPSAMVDSSSKIKGTLEAPALKPEVLPGTRSFSQDVWNRLVVPAAKAIAKQGQNGASLARDMMTVRDVPAVRYGMEFGAPFEEMYNKVPKELSEQVGNEIRMVLENKSFESDLPSDLRILRSQMADLAKQSLGRIADEATELGMKVTRRIPIPIEEQVPGGPTWNPKIVDFAPRENYFPRVIKPEILEDIVRGDTPRLAEMAKHMVESRQARTFNAGMEMVRDFRKNLIDRKYGNLERAREMDLPPKFYETNAFKVIPYYMRAAMQRLAEVRTYGHNDMNAIAKINAIAQEGGDADLAFRTFRRVTGRDPVDQIAKGAFSAIRNWATGSLIQFQTTLYHLPRTVYPAIEAGYYRAIKGFANSFGEASELEARRMGVNLNQAMSEFLQSEYGGGKTMSGKFANATLQIEGIKPLDRFDRKYAAIVGKDWVKNDLVKTILKSPGNKRARLALQEFGLDPDKIVSDKGISDLDLNLAGKRFSDRTQGAPETLTLPLWASTHPYINMMFQFKNFIYTISREMGGVIARAAKSGDAATLTRMATLPMAGATVYGIRHELGMHDTQYVKNPKMNMALNILRDTVPLPLGADVFMKILQGRKGVQDLLLPPSLSGAADILGDIGEAVSKHKVTKAVERDLLRHVPLIGTALSHEVKGN